MERYKLDEKTALVCVNKYRERYNPIGVYRGRLYAGNGQGACQGAEEPRYTASFTSYHRQCL